MHNWFVYRKFEDASKAAADFIAIQIDDSIKKKGTCHVILPGGNTPAVCLNYLSEKTLPWNKIHWYLGDERCYATGHEERNDVMLDKNLWSKLKSPNVYRIPAELGAEEGAAAYRETISGIKSFDIAFMGMGEDGHTASLFPDNKGLDDTRSVIPVFNSPKAPDERVSLSINTLKHAEHKIVLVSGSAKAEIIKRIKSGDSLPINSIGDIDWFIDEAAVRGQ